MPNPFQQLIEDLIKHPTPPFNPDQRERFLLKQSNKAGQIHGYLLDNFVDIAKTVGKNRVTFKNSKAANSYFASIISELGRKFKMKDSDLAALREMVSVLTSADSTPRAAVVKFKSLKKSVKGSGQGAAIARTILGIAADAAGRKSPPHAVSRLLGSTKKGAGAPIVAAPLLGVAAHDVAGAVMGAIHGAFGGPLMWLVGAMLEAPVHSLLAAI
ncbi:MAG TPA: hypothetical protein VHW45_16370 [Candidatus Sulfotelmatobacter sp.]|jgi:hypothetical protein|nr:hypothetical protein [Candidatus Sulfotelmatobacter sp.]